MKKLSTNGIIVCASLLLTGITSTLNAHTTHPRFIAPNQNVSYNASDKTDRKAAMIFQQLVRNHKNLQINAEVAKKHAPQRGQQLEVAVNYTFHGKTDMKKLRKFIKLFKSNKTVYVSATLNVKTNNTKRIPEAKKSKPKKNPNLYNNLPTAYVYNGYPVPVMQSIATQEAAQYPLLSAANSAFPMDYSAHYSTLIAAR